MYLAHPIPWSFEPQIFKILVSTPHNTPIIMGGRHKNFEDPRLEGQGNMLHKIPIQMAFCNNMYATFGTCIIQFADFYSLLHFSEWTII